MNKECRCCKNIINVKPVLTYHNLPEKVQGFDKSGAPTTDKAIDLEIYECPHCGATVEIDPDEVDFDEDALCPQCGKELFPHTGFVRWFGKGSCFRASLERLCGMKEWSPCWIFWLPWRRDRKRSVSSAWNGKTRTTTTPNALLPSM